MQGNTCKEDWASLPRRIAIETHVTGVRREEEGGGRGVFHEEHAILHV